MKKRGRPRIKEHQEQHQIVHVNIGRSTNSSENKERKRNNYNNRKLYLILQPLFQLLNIQKDNQ